MYGNMTVARQLPPDPRQKSWLMMQSPYPNLVISLLYVYAVTVWGPRYMSKRKPVAGLRPYMMIYNAFQVVFSAYLFLEVITHLFLEVITLEVFPPTQLVRTISCQKFPDVRVLGVQRNTTISSPQDDNSDGHDCGLLSFYREGLLAGSRNITGCVRSAISPTIQTLSG